jgi:hypothetical protein
MVEDAGEPKVGDFQMVLSFNVNQNVGGLEITVDDARAMQEAQSRTQLTAV